MIDVQRGDPEYCIPIHRVGINGLKLPIHIEDRQAGVQHTVANIDVYVDLDEFNKGTHMSRLAIGVQKFVDQKLNSDKIRDICSYIAEKCDAKLAQVIFNFPYFIKKNAPVSKEPGYIYCDVEFNVTFKGNNNYEFDMGVTSYCTSLCPCSKEISEHGAHNQRSKIKITCSPKDWVWIEELVELSENCSSCELYSVLKRTDEKYVTEKAYNNPRFVEDMVRSVFNSLSEFNGTKFNWFKVEVWNDESIHQHQAFASIDSRNCG